ncbi:HNH endonuclease family protein [Micromonospora sp. NPDC051141]|uniref:HNH endonuclease family protein n=1 Tax=Micromonospora sp. NPDC051141 TaxID=3364284 RepID=UPI0037A6B1B3
MRTRSGVRAGLTAALTAVLALGAAGCDGSVTEPDAPPSASGNVNQQLGELTVASAGSMKGYSRSRFPHWRDTGKNCDVRDTVLQRDGENIKLSGCNVVGGRWESAYDGVVLTDPSDVDIDHIVPLANAWRSGADEWDDSKRGDFANDQTRPQLIAVSLRSNRAKGDQDPSQWKPANRSYWCQYAADWVTVKHYWRLTVTSAEKAALTDMLEGCTWASKP